MANRNARVGEAIMGEAQLGHSDMPDTSRSPESFSWEGHCWERVTDPDLDTALVRPGGSTVAQDAFAARLANILRLNVANLVVTEGATINQLVALAIAGATADFQKAFIQNLRTSGATIDEAVIGDLAANIITSGLFRTASEGQRLEIDSSGLIMWGIDADGAEYEMVRIGPSGENLLTIGDTTVSPDSVSSLRGDFETLSAGGQELTAILDSLPRGRVAQNRYTMNSAYSDRAQSRLSTQFIVEPGRRYAINVSPFYLQAQAPTDVTYRLVYSWDSLSTVWPENAIAEGSTPLTNTNTLSVPGLVADLPTSHGAGPREIYLTLLVRPARSAVRVVARGDYPLTITVDDVGQRIDDVGSHWTYGNVTESETGPPPAPATPTNRRLTTTWNPQGWGGDISGGDIYQGTWPGVGNRWGGWIFSSAMRSALSGSTIEKFEIYVYATHWYYGSGGTVSLRPNDGTYKGTVFGNTNHDSPRMPRNAGRWITIPASWYPFIQNGTYRGISVHAHSSNTIYYGQFQGRATQFRATYRTRG